MEAVDESATGSMRLITGEHLRFSPVGPLSDIFRPRCGALWQSSGGSRLR